MQSVHLGVGERPPAVYTGCVPQGNVVASKSNEGPPTSTPRFSCSQQNMKTHHSTKTIRKTTPSETKIFVEVTTMFHPPLPPPRPAGAPIYYVSPSTTEKIVLPRPPPSPIHTCPHVSALSRHRMRVNLPTTQVGLPDETCNSYVAKSSDTCDAEAMCTNCMVQVGGEGTRICEVDRYN